MCKTRLFSTLILFALTATLFSTPRLTVVVVIDGLNQDNLNLMQPYWQAGGIRTLSEDAFVSTIRYPHLVFGGVETIATLMTGQVPSQNGITMNSYFDRKDRMIHSSLEDCSEKGIGSVLRLSPRSILSLTLADQFRLNYGKNASIYAIGQDAETAIILGGHAANACCWMDYQTDKWATTSYYPGGLPQAADEYNMSGRIEELAAQDWTPRMDMGMYLIPTEKENKHGFSYTMGKELQHSPAINTLTIELVLSLQKMENLGKNASPSLLLLQLTTLTPKATTDMIQSAEQEDQYMHLNQDLGYMMEQLERRLGKDEIEIIVMGVPRLGLSVDRLAEVGYPIRQFSVERAAALTSAYLMALYGRERWVDGGYGHSIYLNRALIEQKRLSLEDIQRQVAHFLMDFEGIQVAYTTHEAYLDQRLTTSLNKRAAGDVVFLLQPGWQLTTGENLLIDAVVDDDPTSPLMIWPMPKSVVGEINDATEVKQKILNL